MESIRTHFRKNGEYKEFYDNGKLKAEGNYEHGNLVGYELRYDIDGNFIEKVFVDDNMDEEEYRVGANDSVGV